MLGTHVQARVVGESPVITEGDVLLLPVFVESLIGLLVEVALLDGDGSPAANLTILVLLLFVALLGSEEVGLSPALAGSGGGGAGCGKVLVVPGRRYGVSGEDVAGCGIGGAGGGGGWGRGGHEGGGGDSTRGTHPLEPVIPEGVGAGHGGQLSAAAVAAPQGAILPDTQRVNLQSVQPPMGKQDNSSMKYNLKPFLSYYENSLIIIISINGQSNIFFQVIILP